MPPERVTADTLAARLSHLLRDGGAYPREFPLNLDQIARAAIAYARGLEGERDEARAALREIADREPQHSENACPGCTVCVARRALGDG